MSTLNQDEIASLMAAIEDGQVDKSASGEPRGPVSVFDLTNPQRNVPGPMPALDGINENIARAFGGALAGRTRKRLTIQHGTIDAMRLEEIRPLMDPPSVVGIIEMDPIGEDVLLLVERNLAESLILAGLGAKDARPEVPDGTVDSALTNLELVVLRRLLSLITSGFAKSYRSIVKFKPTLTRVETDPRMTTASQLRDLFVLSSFEVTGEIAGRFQLAMPFSVLEATRKRLSPVKRLVNPDDQPLFARALDKQVSSVELDLIVKLGRAPVSYDRLLNLGEGDVLLLDTDEGSQLKVSISGHTKFLGRPCVEGGNLAITVEEVVDKNEMNPTKVRYGLISGLPPPSQPH
ncbi:MAG: hypothetical protein GY822_19710 [Deltaproteobacteria bacterium]|nr:hypothetical protein [Deltaproteobacteria bacterium]